MHAVPAGTIAEWKACHTGMLNHLLEADGKSGLRKSAEGPSVGSQPVNSFSLDLRGRHVLHIRSGRYWVTVSKWLLLKFRERERSGDVVGGHSYCPAKAKATAMVLH